MNLTYQQIADHLGVELCIGNESLDSRGHRVGYVAHNDPRIHWADRRVTKPGLRNFLMLVAAVELLHNTRIDIPPWRKIYQQSTWAQKTAETEFRVRLPKRYSLPDRSRVKYLMSKEWVSPLEAKTISRWTQGE